MNSRQLIHADGAGKLKIFFKIQKKQHLHCLCPSFLKGAYLHLQSIFFGYLPEILQPLFIFLVTNNENRIYKLGEAAFIHRQLIEDCKRGNDHARFEIYRLYSKAMFNVCCRMMGNREDAEDMLQEVFLLVFTKLESFRYESSFGTWLKTITVRTCINAINKRKIDLVYCDEINDKRPSEEEAETVQLTTENILKAMETLPEGGRIVFSLYLLEGYDHGEIAQIMGITESTSKSQFMRAKRRVQEILRKQQMQAV